MNNVVKLMPAPTPSEEMQAECISILESALERAKDGNVESCIIVMRAPSGFWCKAKSSAMSVPESIGYLEIVKQEWISEYIVTSVEE